VLPGTAVYYGEQVEAMRKQRENEECFAVPSNNDGENAFFKLQAQ